MIWSNIGHLINQKQTKKQIFHILDIMYNSITRSLWNIYSTIVIDKDDYTAMIWRSYTFTFIYLSVFNVLYQCVSIS
ncbi:hypothetical protein DERF_016724 [Dermatophagoides farinae]|uniref:Uncharacterized protein n=1 Tax=Dermatophagoides farinae TaxID=6954 RepID=A0A922HK91_DERFA|nr:hypothetical protein DERF_016724 [Dermatophagoides farinae]